MRNSQLVTRAGLTSRASDREAKGDSLTRRKKMITRQVPSISLAAGAGLCALLAVLAFATTCSADDLEIEVEISPKRINFSSTVQVITVHTDIAYVDVDGRSVVLFYREPSRDTECNIAISYWKSDDRGNFVAKFSMGDFRNIGCTLEIPGTNTFGMDGRTVHGQYFFGYDDVMVVDGGLSQGQVTSSNE